jgi:hypothetical protein
MREGVFKAIGDGYLLAYAAAGVEFHADRLRWQGDELKGELAVMCGIVGGRAVDGCLARGTFNFSSLRARDEHAKYLKKRARTGDEWPWLEWLEELCERTVRDLRNGLPAVLLRDVPLPGPNVEHVVEDWHLPSRYRSLAYWPIGVARRFLKKRAMSSSSSEDDVELFGNWSSLGVTCRTCPEFADSSAATDSAFQLPSV